jgi:hypothetical protein
LAKQFPSLTKEHRAFIARQHMFFTASTAEGARINLSPKGLDALRIVSDNAVAYLDLTGSGNETAAHCLADGRLTLMFCAFEGAPLILRLYGHGQVIARGSADYAGLLPLFGPEPPGARQMIRLDIDLVQTSCGFGVPLFAYQGERPTLIEWAEKKGEAGLKIYRQEKNIRSIDGLPTGLLL